MIALVPMTEADFGRYCAYLASAYAQDQVAAGEWTADPALQRAEESIRSALPEGLKTGQNYLYLIHDPTVSEPVGQVWFTIDGDSSAFIMDIEIYAAYQRRGYAQQTLQAVEEAVKVFGVTKIGLHVHAHNGGAKALYEKMGYGVTGYSMLKRLDANA